MVAVAAAARAMLVVMAVRAAAAAGVLLQCRVVLRSVRKVMLADKVAAAVPAAAAAAAVAQEQQARVTMGIRVLVVTDSKATFPGRASPMLAAAVAEVKITPAASAVLAAVVKVAGRTDNRVLLERTLAVAAAVAARV